ncbi:MAG: SIMPL domain-containing protein [Spirochaetales bacterium]|nr:SIMPL domain-containing protein [Spirochaetales bacterium]
MKKIGIVLVVVLAALFLVSCQGVSLIEKSRTVTVQGSGKVTVTPDLASLNVTVSELADTTYEAQQMVNTKISRLLEMTTALGVGEEDLKTTALEFYPEYRWKESEQILVGQRVQQRLFIKVRDIEKTLPALIDQLATLSGISIGQVSFTKEETSEEFVASRTLAMEKAIEKAGDYARAAGMKLGKPITVNDYSAADVRSAPVALMAKAAAEDSFMGSQLPAGTLDITTTVTVVFELL